MYLPKNNWYEFWTNEFYEGQQEVNVAAPLDKIPFFVEAGTILPIAPVMQYTNERPIDIMTLNVYYKKGITDSELYQDAGDGYGYQSGNYSLHLLELNAADETATIHQNKAGNLIPTYQFKLNFIGFPFEMTTCEVDEASIAVTENSCIVTSDFKVLVVK